MGSSRHPATYISRLEWPPPPQDLTAFHLVFPTIVRGIGHVPHNLPLVRLYYVQSEKHLDLRGFVIRAILPNVPSCKILPFIKLEFWNEKAIRCIEICIHLQHCII